MATRDILHTGPTVDDHGRMVKDVEERQLVVLLPQDEEDLDRKEWIMVRPNISERMGEFISIYTRLFFYRVTEFDDLGEEKPPTHIGHLKKQTSYCTVRFGRKCISQDTSMFFVEWVQIIKPTTTKKATNKQLHVLILRLHLTAHAHGQNSVHS